MELLASCCRTRRRRDLTLRSLESRPHKDLSAPGTAPMCHLDFRRDHGRTRSQCSSRPPSRSTRTSHQILELERADGIPVYLSLDVTNIIHRSNRVKLGIGAPTVLVIAGATCGGISVCPPTFQKVKGGAPAAYFPTRQDRTTQRQGYS